MAEHRTPRQIMDPDATLPKVELVPDPSKLAPGGSLRPQDMLIMHEGSQIGTATLTEELKRKNAWFNGVRVNAELQGQGYGMATYLAAIEHAHANGETFRTHEWSQTESAMKVWTRFIDAGIAQVIEAPHLDASGERYNMEAIIPPPAAVVDDDPTVHDSTPVK
jgi:GNAT superfamily N-acetyltransferase